MDIFCLVIQSRVEAYSIHLVKFALWLAMMGQSLSYVSANQVISSPVSFSCIVALFLKQSKSFFNGKSIFHIGKFRLGIHLVLFLKLTLWKIN